ncbi:MAG TPA: protein kinase [Thermoanaerobaculia bacterium]|nr:protein kinase [Thermoanaerobaculia bacterium]
MIGQTVSHYRVLEKLGGGGMGLVYKAQDLRLDRLVALKFLRDNPGEMDDRRLFQEARAASALDHPNICTVFDIDETPEGQRFIVMALYEGETLKQKIQRGPLKISEALEIDAQIAAGLAQAHARGIVHRDIKPSNVVVTSDGQVKILDFGVARLMDATRLTQTGIALGTVAYMSPEQIRGEAVDHRTDIWSLGVVLYEMIAGRPPFRAGDDQTTAWVIQFQQPEPLTALRTGVPMELERIVMKAMAKDPSERYQHVDEIPVDLRACLRLSGSSAALSAPTTIVATPPLSRPPAPTVAPPEPSLPRRSRTSTAFLLAGAAALLLALWIALGATGRVPFPLPTTAGSKLPTFELLTFRRGTIRTARFSPDGQTVVFGAAWDGEPFRIFLTRPDSPQATEVELPPADLLSVSRKGETAISIAPRMEGALMMSGLLARAPLLGGAPREMQENVREADWTPEGSDLLVVRSTAAGEHLEFPVGRVLYETSGYISHARFSPDGQRIAFLAHPVFADDRGDVAVVDLQGRHTTLSAGWSSVRGLAWSPNGKEVWFTGMKGGEDFALYGVSLAGRERTLLTSPGSMILLDVASSGKILLNREEQVRLTTVHAPGEDEERDFTWLDLSAARFISDDGRHVLFTHFGHGSGADYSVYLRGTAGGPGIRLGEGEARAISPDGRWAASLVHGTPTRILFLPTGAGQAQVLTTPLALQSIHWFPDGRRLLLVGRERGRGMRSYVQELRGGQPRPITPEGVYSVTWSPISPDGKLVIATGLGNRSALYPVDGGKPRPIQGLAPGEVPSRWTADGRALFVQRSYQVPFEIHRLDLESGRRTLWKRIRPADLAGVIPFREVLLTPDGEAYVYNSERLYSHLYLAEGIR